MAERFRERFWDNEDTHQYHFIQVNSGVDWGGAYLSKPTGFERIREWSTPQGGGFCDHRSITVQHSEESIQAWKNNSAESIRLGGLFADGGYQFASNALSHHKRFYKASVADIENRIVNPEGYNFFLPLAELKDIGSLARSAVQMSVGIADILNSKGIRKNQLRATPLKAIGELLRTKDFTGDYLTAVFGVVPLYNDIVSLQEAIESYQDHMADLWGNNGLWQNVYFKKTYRKSNTEHLWSGMCRLKRTSHRTTVLKSSVEARYELDFTYPSFAVSGLNYFGLDVDWSDLWELVPMSFVIDWLFAVGDVIEDLDTTLITDKIKFKDGWISNKTNVSGNVSVDKIDGAMNTGNPTYWGPPYIIENGLVNDFAISSYIRHRYTPPLVSTSQPRGINSIGKATSALFLAEQRTGSAIRQTLRSLYNSLR